MTECEFCGEEFGSQQELHSHWQEHEEELNSHQKDQMKTAVRKENEKKEEKIEKRKSALMKVGGGIVLVALLGFGMAQFIGAGGEELDLTNQPMMGDENASVEVVAIGDYRCPYCQRFDTQVLPQIEQEYVETGDAKVYWINFAFLGEGSTEAAAAAECVYEQNEEQFWNFHREIYENQGPESERWVSQELLMELARNSTQGIDYESLSSCIENGEKIDEVERDNSMVRGQGITTTPTVMVNGETIDDWSYSGLSSAIESELK